LAVDLAVDPLFAPVAFCEALRHKPIAMTINIYNLIDFFNQLD